MINASIADYQEEINRNIVENSFKKGRHNFRIVEGIWFSDDEWDFNMFNTFNRACDKYRLNFDSIIEPLKLGCKIVILNALVNKGIKCSTAKKEIEAINGFSRYCEDNLVDDIRLINLGMVKEYFEVRIKHIGNDNKNRRARHLRNILQIYSKYDIYSNQQIIEYLNKFIKDHPSKKEKTSKNQYIPDKLSDQICSLAVKDLNDESLGKRHRMVAGLLVILIETGMRIEELTMLENNRIRSEGIGDKKVYYLEFYTFKITEHGEERRLTYTFLTDLALNAYQKICKLREEIILGLSEMSRLRLMCDLKKNSVGKGRKKISELREEVAGYSQKEIEEIENEMNRFIYISHQTGRQKRGTTLFVDNMREFFIRHDKDIDLSEIDSKYHVKYFRVTSIDKYKKFFLKEERKRISFDEIQKKKYLWINPHAFRVTVCTKLFLKKINLDYIVKHLNHLSEDMTVYYNKSVEFEKALVDTIQVWEKNTSDEGLIESDPGKAKSKMFAQQLANDEFRRNIQQINTFLAKNKLNINTDMERILKVLKKTNSPVVESGFGICIVSVVQSICERRKYFSSMDDNYYLGIVLDTYKNIGYSYERFMQKVKVIEHNKEIALKNQQYVNEYEREVKALKYYVNKKLIKELELLERDIQNKGISDVKREYPQLEFVIDNYYEIRKEVEKWIE